MNNPLESVEKLLVSLAIYLCLMDLHAHTIINNAPKDTHIKEKILLNAISVILDIKDLMENAFKLFANHPHQNLTEFLVSHQLKVAIKIIQH
jgi:hypothetical protein